MPLHPSPAVVRAGELLTRLTARPAVAFTVSELARDVGIPRATCDSLLQGLAEHGLVRRDGALRYQLGPACILLGDAARAANPTLGAAGIHAEALARDQAAVVAVSVRDGLATRLVGVYDFGPPFRIRPRPGDAIALVPPFGASFVAWDEPARIRAWLERAEPALTPAEFDRYHAALEAVRLRGYSITVNTGRQPDPETALERLFGGPDAGDARRVRAETISTMTHSDYLTAELDLQGTIRLTQISAPIFEPGGAVAASLMLLGPSHDVTAEQINRYGAAVLAAADAATAAIGGTHPPRPRA